MTNRCKKLQCFLAAMAAQCVALSAAWAADPQNPAEVRTRQVETGPAAAAANATPEVGAEVVYAFFPDVAYTVTVSRVEQIAPGTTAIQSVANDGRDITCLSIQSPDGLRLTVRDLGRRRLYQCVSLSGGKWEYREYDLSKELPRTPHPPIKPPEEEDKTEATAPFDPAGVGVSGAEPLATSYLDIMFVFDTTAQTWAAANGGIAAFAADAVARMNIAMQTTGIDCTFRLAATVNKSYTYDGGGLATPLYAIRNNEGVFSDVETLRTTYGADLVTLMVDTGSAYGNTGIGFVLSSSSGHASYAYTTCSIRAVNQGHTHTHEIGHNLGCGHATNQASSPGPALFSYSSGYYFTASGNDYHTIMAYNSDGYGGFYDECDYFSTPLKTFGTSGVVVGNSSTADNARTIRETMSVVSAYRDSVLDPSPPAAPTGVNATDGSSTANVGVSWSASSGATSYSVWRGTSSSSGSAASIASGLTSTSHNDTSATPGALYYYWVKASNSAGTSGFSSSNTGYRGLSVPGGVSATDGTSTTQVTVNWGAVTGASYYRVYRATTSGGTKTALGSWQTGLSYADTSASAGTTYYYFVVAAVDASGTRPSTYSSYNTGYRAVVAIPAPPTGVNAADGSSTANVAVTWTASSGATSYSVWRGTSSSSGSAASIASGLTSTSHNDTSATPGVRFYYWVKATNAAGTSGFSSSNTGYRGLSAPGGVSATDGTSTTQVTVTWNAVTGASHYRVYRATTSGGTKTALGSWQTGLSYADTSASAGTTYYYFVVAAVDASGTRPSTYSSYNTGYRAVVAIPAPPTGVNAADGSSTANVAVTWTASSGATSYSVWRGTSSSSGSAASIASGLTSTSHNDTSATPGVRYYYWVKATNAAGTSGFSASDTGYRKLAAPTISATTTDPYKVRVSWGAPAGASFYRVSRATTSSGVKTVVSDGWQGAQSFDDATAAVGTTFYYFVEAAVDSAGARPSAYSAYATGSRPLPPNNAFASATAISGPTGSVNGPTEGATKEAGEPEHNGEATAVNSVWWAWTAPYSGMATFDTVGSAFDTVLAVYTGTSVGALTAVASNDDAVGLVSRVSFNATGGTVYRIAVAGYGGASGRAVLNWSLVSPIEPTIKSSGITTSAGTLYFQMTFKTKAGKSYTVQRTDSLTSPSWTTVSTVSATADGLKSVSIAIPSNKPAGYYRVKTTE